MEQIIEDLWPKDMGVSNVITPVSVLREQAVLLGKKTRNLVQAEVSSRPALVQMGKKSGEGFIHRFVLVAPALNYRYLLFVITHDIALYPLYLYMKDIEDTGDTGLKVTSIEEFKDRLKDIFASDKTKQVIQALIAQSQA